MTVAFNYLGKLGQLGNQMFQYAATLGVAGIQVLLLQFQIIKKFLMMELEINLELNCLIALISNQTTLVF